MAYSKPTNFTPNAYILASQLNTLKDNDNAINDLIQKYQLLQGFGALSPASNQLFYFVHLHKWLYFKGTGALEDALGVEESISLSSTTDSKYDLNAVSWMYVGKLIRVSGVEYCFEKG